MCSVHSTYIYTDDVIYIAILSFPILQNICISVSFQTFHFPKITYIFKNQKDDYSTLLEYYY